MEEMVFTDLKPVELAIRVGDVRYILREADEGAAALYRSAAAGSAKFDDGKIVGVQGVGNLQAVLLSQCLYRAIDVTPETPAGRIPLDNVGNPDRAALVPAQMIRVWPARVVKAIFDKAKEISRLDESETTESLEAEIAKMQARLDKLREASAKNSPPATRDISE